MVTIEFELQIWMPKNIFLCLYIGLPALSPIKILIIRLYYRISYFWVRTNLKEVCFHSILWTSPILCVIPHRKLNLPNQLYTLLQVPFSWWSRYFVRFDEILPIQSPSQRNTPLVHTLQHLNEASSHSYHNPSLSSHLIILFIVIPLVDLHFEFVVNIT